jgi:threonine dehydratase
LAVRFAYPDCTVYAVEPEGYDDMALSIQAGTRRFASAPRSTACDALQAAIPGAIPFAVCKQLAVGACSVGDAEVLRAMAMTANYFKLVVDPSGAAALAAALAQTHARSDGVGVILSGGNVDTAVWTAAVGKYVEI